MLFEKIYIIDSCLVKVLTNCLYLCAPCRKNLDYMTSVLMLGLLTTNGMKLKPSMSYL